MRRLALPALLISLLIVIGCGGGGTVRAIGPAKSRPYQQSERPVSQRVVSRAFEAAGRLPARVRVAYYTTSDEVAAIIELRLAALPRVASVYRIPRLLVSGRRRFEAHSTTEGPVDLDRLRVLAARARAHVVLLLDYGYRADYAANGLVVFSAALLPILFVPLRSMEAKSYLDGYLVDTLTGHHYGDLRGWRGGGEPYLTIYSSAGDELVERQRRQLVGQTVAGFAALLAGAHAAPEAPVRAVAETAAPAAGPLSEDTQDPWADRQRVEVTVKPDSIAVNRREVDSMAAFVGAVFAMTRQGPTRAVVRADEGVEDLRIAEIVALLKELGVRQVVVSASPTADPDVPPPSRVPKVNELKPPFL